MAGFPYETITKLTQIIEDNLNYSKDIVGSSQKNPLLTDVENATSQLIEKGKALMNNSRDKKRKAASRAMDNYKKEAKKNKPVL
ncbi:MAG: hypothetical protein IJP84_04335 [Lachnospiraceae bacterium]|nr:hypothetical protein [Lachnospiraceae bacterium]